MKMLGFAGVLALVLSTAVWASEEEQMNAEQQEYMEWALGVWESLSPQTGDVLLEQANVTLTVPEEFYFLAEKDALTVLVDVWGNPPGQEVLGMLFPAESTPFDGDAWAVIVQYEEEGYVSDEDAAGIDYSEMLQEMQRDTRADSAERVKQGYEPIELVGWASAPYYDAGSKKLHWAKELKFGDAPEHTLNYNIRVLGRKGVLILNFVADMSQKAVIEESLDSVVAMAEFNEGARYADFNPEIDQVAAYGIGALIAGKVASKAGLLAAAMLFLKKFWMFLAVGIFALLKKVFGRGKAATTTPGE